VDDFYFNAVSKAVKDKLQRGIRVTLNTDDPGVMGNRHLN
jgi:adenosine deaminase